MDLCKAKNVIMIAQVMYKYTFHTGIKLGKVKRGWNDIISYSNWDSKSNTYTGIFVSSISRSDLEAVKKEYLKLTNE